MQAIVADTLTDYTWQRLLARDPAAAAASSLYGPLIGPPAASDGCFVLGHIAQSLDGRIATANGASQWISGPADILHTHRLRALFDAIVVGAGTVQADDPQLTTRDCAGPSPVRVIIDTDRRLAADRRVFHTEPATLLLCAEDAGGPDKIGRATVRRLPRQSADRHLASHDIIATLAAAGLRRIFVEGGGTTISRFLAGDALDRLHVTVAPLLLGCGIPAFTLPELKTPTDGLRLNWRVHHLGDDLLLDIGLQRRVLP